MDERRVEFSEMEAQRARMRRSILRTTAAVGLVWGVVLALAGASIWAGVRANRNEERARWAEREAKERLGHAYLAQARAARLAGKRGRRQEALSAVRNASAILRTVELRNEAIAALGCLDLELDEPVWKAELPFRQAYAHGLETFAISASDGEVTVYRSADRAILGKLSKSAAGVGAGASLAGFEFSRSGRRLMVLFKNATLVVWDVEALRPLWTRRVADGARFVSAEWTWDDEVVIAERLEGRGRITRVDPANGRSVAVETGPELRGASVRPGSGELAVSMGQEVQLRSMESADVRAIFPCPGVVGPAIWSGDGMRFAVVTSGGPVQLWHVKDREFRSLTGHTESVRTLVFSPDGGMLLTSAGDNSTRLWDTSAGIGILECEGAVGTQFSEDGRRIGFAQPGLGVGVWRFETQALVRRLRSPGASPFAIRHFDLSADGRWLAALTPGWVHLWDLEREGGSGSETAVRIWPVGERTSLSFLPGGEGLMVSGTNGLQVYRAAGGVEDERGREVMLPKGVRVRQATVAMDGKTVLVEGMDRRLGVMREWGAAGVVWMEGTQKFLNSLTPGSGTGSGRFTISPDGKWAALGYSWVPEPSGSHFENRAGVWETATGRLVFNPEGAGGVAFSPDGRSFLLRSDSEIQMYGVGEWKRERAFRVENMATHVGAVAMTLEREGGYLAGSSSRQQIQLHDVRTGEALAVLTSPVAHSVSRIRCSHDGRRLVMGTTDNQILEWDMRVLREELGKMGLDWGVKGEKNGGAAAKREGRDVAVGLAGVVMAGAVVAVLMGGWVLWRHRNLVEAHLRASETVEARERQLAVARAELYQSEKMKALGTLAAGVAHDFNNLLSIIRMSNQLIPRASDDGERREYVDAVERAVLQGKAVAQSMLAHGRDGGAGAGVAGNRGSEVGALVSDMARLMSKKFLKGVRLELKLGGAAPRVRVSELRLRQCLLNLLVNAAEALAGRGVIRVEVCDAEGMEWGGGGGAVWEHHPAPAGRKVAVRVRDTGPGMERELMARIFEPFFSTKRGGEEGGVGLGLAMVGAAAVEEGFGLAVWSAVGEGTEFCLWLPVWEGEGSGLG